MTISGRAFWFLTLIAMNVATIIFQFNSKEPMVWLICGASVVAGYFFNSFITQIIKDS